MYVVVFGQCLELMRAKIEGDFWFDKIKQDLDVAALLKLIQNRDFDIETDCNPFVAQMSATKNYINIKQGFITASNVYYDAFINNQEVREYAGVDLGTNTSLINIIIKQLGLDLTTIGGTKKIVTIVQATDLTPPHFYVVFMCNNTKASWMTFQIPT